MIDVLRAFTTAAVGFSRGAGSIAMVGTPERARTIRAERSGWLTVGEVDGLPIADFDYLNSPSELAEAELSGRHLIMRTSSGTQGVIRAAAADRVLCASMANATATARRIRSLGGDCSFVISGSRPHDHSDEDRACADLIGSVLDGVPLEQALVERRVRGSSHARVFADPTRPEFPAADLDWACRIDWADFVMEVEPGPVPLLRPKRNTGGPRRSDAD